MVDFCGEKLEVEDTVIFMAPGYRMLVRGTITSFTPKNVRVAYINTWNYSKPGRPDEILQESTQLVKV